MTRTETVLASKKYHRFDLQIERIINKKSESSAHKKAQEIGAGTVDYAFCFSQIIWDILVS